jgi:hypothetical protein
MLYDKDESVIITQNACELLRIMMEKFRESGITVFVPASPIKPTISIQQDIIIIDYINLINEKICSDSIDK